MSGTKIAGDALISALSFAEHSCLQLMSDGVAAHLPVMNYYLPCWLSRLLLSTRAARVRVGCAGGAQAQVLAGLRQTSGHSNQKLEATAGREIRHAARPP